MRSVATQYFVCVMLAALCVQGTAAVISSQRGPAHVHVAARAQASTAAHAASHAHPANHSHTQVRRHYHLPGSDAVLVADHNHDSGTAAELTSRGEPVSAAFIAVMSDDALFTPTDPRGSLAIADAKKLSSSIPRRIERPPRSRLA